MAPPASGGQSMNWQEMVVGVRLMRDAVEQARNIVRIGVDVEQQTPLWTGDSKESCKAAFADIAPVLNNWIAGLEDIANKTEAHARRTQENEQAGAASFRT